MKAHPRPTPEAIARIRALGEEAILAFLDEVSLDAYKGMAEYLPNVPGFRKKSVAGIKQQKLALAKKLTSKPGKEVREHRALYLVWRSWAWEHLGDPENVEGLIDGFEKSNANNQKPINGESAGVEPSAIALFSGLRQMSLENKCTQEAISRFFEFSPFSPDAEITELIERSKPASEVERDATITELPRRLRKDEDDIKIISARLDALAEQVISERQRFYDLAQNLSELHNEVGVLSEALAQMRAPHERALSDIKDNHEEIIDVVRDMEDMRRRVESHAGQLQNVAKTAGAIGEITREVSEIALTLGELKAVVAQLSTSHQFPTDEIVGQLKLLAEQVAGVTQSAARADVTAALSVRLDALEELATSSVLPPEETKAQPFACSEREPENRGLDVLRASSGQSKIVQKLASFSEIAEALSDALQGVGLKKSAALVFAEEVAVAVICNQVVFLKGSLGSTVAIACANALSANCGWRISIPIGLTDGSSIRAEMGNIKSDTQAVATVILEGFNRSALDAICDALIGGKTIFCFATILDGLASLPLEPAYSEYGPVFDLDYLEWRSRTEPETRSASGSVSVEAYASIRKTLLSALQNADEPLRLLKEFMPKRNVRIERTIVSSYCALNHIRADKAMVTALQSLIFGWLAPLWISSGLSQEEADSELDGGKLDGLTVDPRIAEMLKSGEFSVVKSSDGK